MVDEEITIDEALPVEYQASEPYRLTEEEVSAAKQAAFQREADPLFFKWQRGECEKQEWLDKVVEIREQYATLDTSNPEVSE
jgi:isoleucyl-tRNA synthetase